MKMMYFKGCVAREKVKNISKATETILKQAGIDYYTAEDEECCGSVLLRTGFLDDAHEQMQKNIGKLEGQKILVSCAGCYKTFKKDYKDYFGIELNVIHISHLLNELISENKLELQKTDLKVTYHDPCHLGRHCNDYESPREILRTISEFIEMDHHHEHALCCGAGGGVKSAFPQLADSIAQERIKEAKKTGADILTTSCPFCKLNLSEANKYSSHQDIPHNSKNDNLDSDYQDEYSQTNHLEIMDLTEFVIQFLNNSQKGSKTTKESKNE